MDWEFAGSLTITGLVVVFSVLVVLCVIIKLFGLAIDGVSKKGQGTSGKKKVKPEPGAQGQTPDGVVAAISAAVAYMMGCDGLGLDDYRITGIRPAKRLRRSEQRVRQRSEWGAAGISEAMR